jgi:GNAT superfamily N-acetyltransferase
MGAMDELQLVQVTTASGMTAGLREALVDCWVAVTNTGGAVGFPFPPVNVGDVAPVADALIGALHPDRTRLLLALDGEALAGWVALICNPSPFVAHWASVQRLQTHPSYRGRGIGAALMRRLHQIARDELDLEQLHLEARGGMGLEVFYARLGWREIGRWPRALRVAPGDDRDEVLMLFELTDTPSRPDDPAGA